MKNVLYRLLLTCLISLSFASLSRGQQSPQPSSPVKDRVDLSGKRTTTMTPEEKIVRAAYEKLTLLNKAAWLGKSPAARNPKDDGQGSKFELSNFRIGPIPDIWGALHSQIKTDGAGEIIRLERSITQLNKEEEHVGYDAAWATGQYASVYDRQWTIGDLLSYEPDRYYDVGEYALYDAIVSYQGKTRAYRALALFHNPYRYVGTLKPEFWDTVVGMGGALTEAWYENRPLIGQKVSSSSIDGATPIVPQRIQPGMGLIRDEDVAAASPPESQFSTASTSSTVQSATQDSRETYQWRARRAGHLPRLMFRTSK